MQKVGRGTVTDRWKQYGLPEDMTNKTFLDVGCLEGSFAVHAKSLGAANSVAIDIVRSPKITENQKKEPFTFLQMDVFSEKWLELPTFQYVYCAGLLYHVESMVGLILRLKSKCTEVLILETEVSERIGPIAEFCIEDTYKKNFSNWWIPTVECVVALLSACGFHSIELVQREQHLSRACFKAYPKNEMGRKILPRNQKSMSI